jgi:ubiquinone/menaquinone biosynthesis C-methylase UbiE
MRREALTHHASFCGSPLKSPALELEMEIQPVKRSKAQAQASYDRLSRWYDALAGGSEKRLIDAGLLKLAAGEGEKVVEIGFGTGHAILALARSVGDSGRVYGVDISAGMLRVAQERVGQAGLAGRVELRQGDAAQLPFEVGSMDAVFSSFALDLFDTPEIPVVLGECQRVLRDGGRLCMVAMSRTGKPGLMVRLYEWAHERFPGSVDCRPIYAQAAVQEAGFRVVDSTVRSTWGLPVEIVLAQKPR